MLKMALLVLGLAGALLLLGCTGGANGSASAYGGASVSPSSSNGYAAPSDSAMMYASPSAGDFGTGTYADDLANGGTPSDEPTPEPDVTDAAATQ